MEYRIVEEFIFIKNMPIAGIAQLVERRIRNA